MRTVRKAPEEVIVEGFDWSDRMDPATDYIADSEWTIDAGLTGSAATFTKSQTQLDLSGGTVNETYKVSNTMTTSTGLVYVKSFLVLVADR